MKRLTFILSVLIVFSCGEQSAQEEIVNSKQNQNSKFILDFSKPKKIIYSYQQTNDAVNKMGKDEKTEKTYTTSFGKLNISVKENQLADLSLTDLKMTIFYYDSEGILVDSISNIFPPTVIQDMNPDGSYKEINNDVIYYLLFTLPSYDFEIGDEDKIPVRMPFNANGSLLWVKGFNTINFKGIETFEGIKCAVIKGKIDISDLEIADELEGEYKSTAKGEATYYFDLANKYFVGVDISMTAEAVIDKEDVENSPFGMYIEIKTDNVYKIRLEKIEE